MKTYLLTIHHIHNFGSIFQSIALFQYLKDQGADIEVIDYRPPYYRSSSNALKSLIGNILNFKYYRNRKRKFDSFIRNNEILTDREYKNFEELKEFQESEDFFISGGDQLWNTFHPSGRDDAYKLLFTNSCYKAAFGTSMGRDSFSKEELVDLAQKTEKFMMIGLRELSTVKILRQYSKRPIYHFVDPVLLFEKEWYQSRYIKKQRPFAEKYAVVYLTPKSELLNEAVKELKKKDYRIVHICGFTKKCDYDYMLKDSGPDDILNAIYHADFVLSASFHATVFSILFQKQFSTLLPNINTNTRINDLLDYCDLKDRVISDKNHLENMFNQISFVNSEENIATLRMLTKDKISSVLRELEKEEEK